MGRDVASGACLLANLNAEYAGCFARSVVDRTTVLQQLHRHGEQFHVPFLDRKRVMKTVDAVRYRCDFTSILEVFLGRMRLVLRTPDDSPGYNVTARPGI